MENPRKEVGKGISEKLNNIASFLHETGPSSAALFAGMMRFIGIWLMPAIDIILGGVATSWLITRLAPEDFYLTGRLLGWLISIIIFSITSYFWMQYKKIEKMRNISERRRFFAIALPLALNFIDSFIDGLAAFIMFGQGPALLAPALGGFVDGLLGMPIIGWVFFFVFFLLSFFAELWRIVLTEGSKDEKGFPG